MPEQNNEICVTVITNARVFDGKNDVLTQPVSVLIEGNKIVRVPISGCDHEGHSH